MEIVIFDGKKYAGVLESKLKTRVGKLKGNGIVPKLMWICVGTAEQNLLYGKLKQQSAERMGIAFEKVVFDGVTVRLPEIMNKISSANDDESVHGVMVQLPIVLDSKDSGKEDVWQNEILQAISSEKDVDCLTPVNLGRLMSGVSVMLPATVAAVVKILEYLCLQSRAGNFRQFLSGKRICVVGGGVEVGRPLVNVLSNDGATVLWARSTEDNLAELTKMADIIISAVGKPGLIKGEMVKEGAVVIDVGSPQGDVDFDPPAGGVKMKASFITPVPGGVGPVTVVSLMENVVEAAEFSR